MNEARYYRGYNLIPRDGVWDIAWGEVIDTAATLEDAEAVVDSYHSDVKDGGLVR